jgi:hypothetical protein
MLGLGLGLQLVLGLVLVAGFKPDSKQCVK